MHIYSTSVMQFCKAIDMSAEITARSGRDIGDLYGILTAELGEPTTDRVEAHATPEQKSKLSSISAGQIEALQLAGEKIENVIDRAPGNNAAIGGIKVSTASGWFAARPSGTEDIYKIYAESFKDKAHLQSILHEAQVIVDHALGTT